MITKNWKNYVNCVFDVGVGTNVGLLAVTNVAGTTYYISSAAGLNAGALTLSATSAGISVGTGNTTPTENDYNLEATITSGLSGTTTIVKSIDANGCPVITYRLALSNTSASDITIKEIGYKANIKCAASQGATGNTDRTLLLDRTVLATPITILAGGNAIIDYKITSVYS